MGITCIKIIDKTGEVIVLGVLIGGVPNYEIGFRTQCCALIQKEANITEGSVQSKECLCAFFMYKCAVPSWRV